MKVYSRTFFKDVLEWIDNFTVKSFKFEFIPQMMRNLRDWLEMLQRTTRQSLMKIEQYLIFWQIKIPWSDWSSISFDYAIIAVDLVDEILEFVNMVVVTLFFPFIPLWDYGYEFPRFKDEL